MTIQSAVLRSWTTNGLLNVLPHYRTGQTTSRLQPPCLWCKLFEEARPPLQIEKHIICKEHGRLGMVNCTSIVRNPAAVSRWETSRETDETDETLQHPCLCLWSLRWFYFSLAWMVLNLLSVAALSCGFTLGGWKWTDLEEGGECHVFT